MRAAGSPRCVLLSVAPSGDAWMIRVAHGERFDALTGGTAYGPFSGEALADRVGELLQQHVAQGYVQLAAAELLAALSHESPRVRGRAAVRLGWRREAKAVEPLLAAAVRARGDICPIVDALGRIGDPRAIELARSLAAKSQLSRRRSGVEALRNLGDAVGLALARTANDTRLPDEITAVLAVLDEQRVTASAVAQLEAAIAGIDPRKAGIVADGLYERDTPLAHRVARRMLTVERIRGPHQWRYAKSILKRTMLRGDAATFGALAYTIERASIGYTGATAVLTSGLDGEKRSTKVFGKQTQAYVLRACWRHLRDLARYRPAQYVEHAARVLACYKPTDAGPIAGDRGAFASAFLLNRILYGASDRLRVGWRSLEHRFVSASAVHPKPGVREEAFAALWDEHPAAYLRLLVHAELPQVEALALAGVMRHPEVLQQAEPSTLLDLVARDREPLRATLQRELERRFAADPNEWALVEAVLARGLPLLRELSLRWLA
ncbi:MAG TPA: HEAT repeat domain-containing protein, partial [Nannocystaceae bacterium]|nr:HEAT repeat domain-containing protein [Nannocystaceae bacterium]